MNNEEMRLGVRKVEALEKIARLLEERVHVVVHEGD